MKKYLFFKDFVIFLEPIYYFHIHLPPTFFSIYLFDHLLVCICCFILSRILFTAKTNTLLECSYVRT